MTIPPQQRDGRDEALAGTADGWSLPIAGVLFVGWIVLAQARPIFEITPGITAWYPPVALLAASAMLWGWRAFLPALAGALTVAVLPHGLRGEPLWTLALTSAALKLCFVAAALAMRRLRVRHALDRPRDVAWFALVAALAAVAATIVATLDGLALGEITRGAAMEAALVHWEGDVVAVFTLSPALAFLLHALARAVARRDAGARAAIAWRRLRPGAVTLAQGAAIAVALLVAFVFAPRLGVRLYALCFLPLAWVALTRGVRGAAVAAAAVATGAVVALYHSGLHPYTLVEAQTLFASLSLTGLLMGAVVEQQHAVQALHARSEERYRLLVELLPDPLVVHAEGRILFANAAAARVLGAASATALAGVPLTELADPGESRDRIAERVRTLGSGEGVALVEHSLRKLDGSGSIAVESVSIPFTYADRPAALTVARDVTVRRRLEEELRHAQRMDAIGRLAGGVAHDFNNLLAVILSYAQILAADLVPGDARRDDVREIIHATERAATLTRQLLAFSRKQVLQLRAVVLRDVVAEADAFLRRLLGPTIVVEVADSSGGAVVLADVGQLEQVLVNLVVNARDAMPEGGRLTIETGVTTLAGNSEAWPSLAGGRYAVLRVRDTGVGMDDTVRARAFEPFFTTKGPSHGTGLGLATVHGIVHQAGGAVQVESTPGLGTTFSILLPVARDAAPSGRAPTPAVVRAAGAALRVLLVDDDGAVRTALRRVLETLGHTVVEAGDGAEALARAALGVDAVVSDIVMPGMDGRRLARELRARYPELPIVLLSGYASGDEEPMADALLRKPVAADALAAGLEAARQRRAERASDAVRA